MGVCYYCNNRSKFNMIGRDCCVECYDKIKTFVHTDYNIIRVNSKVMKLGLSIRIAFCISLSSLVLMFIALAKSWSYESTVLYLSVSSLFLVTSIILNIVRKALINDIDKILEVEIRRY